MNVFREGKFELLALTETKLKGNRKISWCGVNGFIDSVQEMERAREGGGDPVTQYVTQCSDRLWMC